MKSHLLLQVSLMEPNAHPQSLQSETPGHKIHKMKYLIIQSFVQERTRRVQNSEIKIKIQALALSATK